MDVYAMYLRKSRADLEAEKYGEGETLARHQKILTELSVRQGLYIGKIYKEIVSGETIEARPEIQQLIRECYEGKYRGIVIIDVDRLSRGNQGDMQTIMDCLKFSNNNDGLLVITPTKIYDVAHNSDDEEYMEFSLFLSRREYKTIQKRLERGRRQAVVEGNYMGSYRPYGYNIEKNKISRYLVPHPEEAEIVKLMFNWAAKEDLTSGQIARRLTTMGVPTYSGLPEWNTGTVKDILINPTYTGKVRWNDRMLVKKMRDGELVKMRPRANHTQHYMLYDGKHTGLVSEELFELVGKRYHSDKTKYNYKLKNPIASLLVCAKCGKAMRHVNLKHVKNARSRYTHAPSQICKVKSATAEDVLNTVIGALQAYIDDFEVRVDNLPDVDENSLESQINALQEQLRKTEKKLNKLFEDYENEIYSANEFVQRKTVNNEKIESIKKQIRELESAIPEKEEYQETISKLHDALDTLRDPSIPADVQNAYLKQIVSRIEFSRENNEEFILEIFLR